MLVRKKATMKISFAIVSSVVLIFAIVEYQLQYAATDYAQKERLKQILEGLIDQLKKETVEAAK
jgi:CRISPR/Cas system CSM-associated protein Csm2 small subunit